MVSIKNNHAIHLFRKLHESAILLKEKFDTGQPLEVIKASHEMFARDLEELRKILPKSVIQQGELLGHTNWLQRHILKGNPQACYGDLAQICLKDIHYVEECYLHYLVDAGDVSERNYEWTHLHPVIRQISQNRFLPNQYADAVEAAYKHINSHVKSLYKEKNENEEDGFRLMNLAFNCNKGEPVIALAEISSENGKNIQEGYMHIFAGAMKGIRNPKAHTNMDVSADEAWEMIVLASHLMRMLDKYNS